MIASRTAALYTRQACSAALPRTVTAQLVRAATVAVTTGSVRHAMPISIGSVASSTRFLSRTATSSQAREDEPVRSEPTSGEQDIIDILTKQFEPKLLQVQDVSGGCGSFYSIQIASSKFKGVPTVKAHRQVNDALKTIIKDIHGLQLRTMPSDD